jgi:DNA polymerase-3 subunit epsilon
LTFSIIDIETTGNSPKDFKIIEIAIVLHDGEKELGSYHSFVNPEESISPFISRLTGITDKDVADAPRFFEIAKEIIEFTQGSVFVAHNVSFDYGVLRREYKRLGYDYRMNHLCTIQTARVLIPGHQSYGLKNITKVLGITLDKHHRAIDDARATAQLFEILFEKDTKDLSNFVKKEINPKVLHPQLNIEEYDDIPNKTGIYKFYDINKELIYIGKSIHIKKRISQHLKNNKTTKAIEMRERIVSIDHEVCGSELIALLKESEQIKKHQPIYNRAQRATNFSHGLFAYKDQKGYWNLTIKKNNLTERPLMTFTSVQKGKAYLEHWMDEYELCQKYCSLHKTSSACFNYNIEKCKGACVEEESVEDYNERVESLMNSLNFNGDSFLILDKGRNSKEYSFVWVDEGEYRGYGFAFRYLIKRNPMNFRKFINIQKSNRDFQSIIKLQLDKNEKLEIIELRQ